MPFKFNTILRAILAGGASTPSFYLNLSNVTNATIYDSQGRGTITSVRDAVISSSISVSRTSGVAPLYVNFDYTATTSSASTNAPHECFFATDFGDPSAGTWANGVQSSGLTSKNTGYGPVTGHVYETPGTYHPQVTVIDGDGHISSRTATITVQDPDVVYAGTDTICISHSGNFLGAPSGCQQVNTSGNTDMYAALNTYMASNTRILFCKADAWTFSAKLTLTGKENLYIGGYGTGVAPAFGNGTLLDVTPSSTFANWDDADSMFYLNTGNSDIKICSMKVTAHPGVIFSGASQSVAGLTYYKIETRGAQTSWSVNASTAIEVESTEVCFYECVVDDVYGYPYIDLPSASCSGAIGTPGVFTATGHPFLVNYKVQTTGTPPTPLAANTWYYVTSTSLTANTFTLSATFGGAPLALTGTGTCTFTAQALGGGVGIYAGITRGALMGCYLDNHNNGEQALRLPFLNTGHVTNNTLKRPNQSKNVIKIHSVSNDSYPTKWSEKFVISGNVIDLRNGYSYNGTTVTEVGTCAMVLGHGAGAPNQLGRNFIIENNYTYSCLGAPKSYHWFAQIGWPDFTVRNNIFDGAVGDRSSSYSTGWGHTSLCMVSVEQGPSLSHVTSGVRIYNNTLYSNLTNPSSCYFVRMNGLLDTVDIKNNIRYLPNRAEDFQYGVYTIVSSVDGSATGVTQSNNTSSHLTSPNFAVQPPVALTDWRPTTDYAVDGGATVPVLRDFNMASRVGGTYDMGAVLP